MQLHRMNIEADGSGDSPITGFGGGKIYYAHDGRNAWHSTWVQRYFDGCMHTTLQSANEYCEGRRKSGSVFYINELPALWLTIYLGTYVLIQINEKNPFGNYSATSPREDTNGSRLTEAPGLFNRGNSASSAIKSFVHYSQHWRKSPDADSIILTWHSNVGDSTTAHSTEKGRNAKNQIVEPLTDSPMHRYTSSSAGSDYLLQWTRERHAIRKKGALDILRETGNLATIVPLHPTAQ